MSLSGRLRGRTSASAAVGLAEVQDGAALLRSAARIGGSVEVVAVDQELVDAAVALVEARFPGEQWAGGAAMRLEDGGIVTSTAPKAVSLAVEVCHETGGLCEAYKLGLAVVASVCVIRSDQEAASWILTPCGVCQERLFSYGPALEVAVPQPGDPRQWQSLRLDEVQPHWWSRVFAAPPDTD